MMKNFSTWKSNGLHRDILTHVWIISIVSRRQEKWIKGGRERNVQNHPIVSLLHLNWRSPLNMGSEKIAIHKLGKKAYTLMKAFIYKRCNFNNNGRKEWENHVAIYWNESKKCHFIMVIWGTLHSFIRLHACGFPCSHLK